MRWKRNQAALVDIDFLLQQMAIGRRHELAAIRRETASEPRLVVGLNGIVHDIDRYDYRAILEKVVGPPHKDMPSPHSHHILFKWGIGPLQHLLVHEGQDILRSVKIDPIVGLPNLGWAPNIEGQHTIGVLREVLDEIKDVRAGGAVAVEDVLRQMGILAANRM